MLIEKRAIRKNIESIILSIKYSCLLEEIKSPAMKGLLGKKDKEQERKRHIDDLNLVIKSIKDNNKPNKYLLFEKNQLADKLDLLSKSRNYKKLKYYIAIETIFDADLMKCPNKDNLLESISMNIFSDKAEIKKIERKTIEINNFIAGNKQDNDSAIAGLIQLFPKIDLAKIDIAKISKVMKRIPLKLAFVGGGGVMAGLLAGAAIIKVAQLKKAKRLSTSSEDAFLFEITRTAVGLFYEKQEAFSKLEFQRRFRLYLKEINLTRKIILENIYNKWYEIEENKEKLKLLNNFDRFLIEKVKFDK